MQQLQAKEKQKTKNCDSLLIQIPGKCNMLFIYKLIMEITSSSITKDIIYHFSKKIRFKNPKTNKEKSKNIVLSNYSKINALKYYKCFFLKGN